MLLYIGMKKNIKIILLVFWMALIFFLSAQIANDSTETTNFVIDILYKLYKGLNIGDLSVLDFTEIVFKPVRKLAHFGEFAILGILMYLNVKEYKKNRVVLFALVLSALYALSDEIHQIFVPGRACTFVDMCIDTSGALIGILLIHLILKDE